MSWATKRWGEEIDLSELLCFVASLMMLQSGWCTEERKERRGLVMAANCSNYAVTSAKPLSIWWPVLVLFNICPTPIISLNLYLWLLIPLHSSLTETYLFSDWIIHLTATIKRNWFPQAIYLMHFIVHLNTVTFASFVLQFWHFRYIMTQ